MPLIFSKATIGAKVESTPYTWDSPGAANYNFKAFNLGFTPEIMSAARNNKLKVNDEDLRFHLSWERRVRRLRSLYMLLGQGQRQRNRSGAS